MNRRHFMQLSAVVPVAGLSFPVREARQKLTIGKHERAHFIVSAHPTDSSAEHFRRSWIGQPFEGFGEWYVDSRERLDLPEHLATLPGTLTLANTTMGAAAEKRRYLIGAFRKDHIAIIVRIIGNKEELMTEIGDHIADQQVPTHFETLWSTVYLRAFIPATNDLGIPVEPDDGFWP